MSGFVGGLIGFVVGMVAGITIMCVLIVGKQGDVHSASPIADSSKEVVRCCECVHCDPANKHCDHPMGTTLPISRKGNDYCSYGERKDGGD